MLVYCWASVADDGPALSQHWMRFSCLLAGLNVFCAGTHEAGGGGGSIGVLGGTLAVQYMPGPGIWVSAAERGRDGRLS